MTVCQDGGTIMVATFGAELLCESCGRTIWNGEPYHFDSEGCQWHHRASDCGDAKVLTFPPLGGRR